MGRNNNALGYGLMSVVLIGWVVYLAVRGAPVWMIGAMLAGGGFAIAVAGFVSSRRSSSFW